MADVGLRIDSNEDIDTVTRDEYLRWAEETCGQGEVERLLACGEELPLRLCPIVNREELPEEFADVLKVRITGWWPVLRGETDAKMPLLKAEWTLVPKDWPGEEPTVVKPVYRNIFFD